MPTWLECEVCGNRFYTACSENHLEEKHTLCDCGERLEVVETNWGE